MSSNKVSHARDALHAPCSNVAVGFRQVTHRCRVAQNSLRSQQRIHVVLVCDGRCELVEFVVNLLERNRRRHRWPIAFRDLYVLRQRVRPLLGRRA